MQLPESLQNAIEQECSAFSHDALRKASQQLTSLYHEQRASSVPSFQNAASRAAYLAVRMPATYAAIHRVLLECKRRVDTAPRSFLDLGAGPGTGSWAAAEVFPELNSITLIEQSRPMAEIGEKFCKGAEALSLQSATWLCQSLQNTIPPADLALLSYVIAELQPAQVDNLLERLWEQVNMVVIIEPGTPDGYRRILKIRDWALNRGGHLIAPCPHREACPMQKPDWCHFPARVERTRMHKFLKGATLGYEDEKFSYIAFGKSPSQIPNGRIVGSVSKGSGFVQFPLCVEGKLEKTTVSRKQETYRLARNAQWGDSWL
jgi:ribosomal protein RSM22 (predicted rRNA methylase)